MPPANVSTVKEVAERGLSYLSRFGYKGPATRDLMYHHIGVQQQRMFAAANQVNPEYFAAQAIGLLSGGAVDLKLLAAPLAMCERVLRVQVEDKGTSAYAVGKKVLVITTQEAETLTLPPRVFIHDGVIQQVGTDLTGVVSIRAFYSEMPPPYDGTTAENTLVRLQSPFDHALGIAMALELVRQATDMADAAKAAAIPVMEKNFAEEMDTFLKHVAGSNPAQTYRSRRTTARP